MIDAALTELEPIVGTMGACGAEGRPRANRYRHLRPPAQGPPRPRPTPPNVLTPDERETVRAVLDSPRFVHRAPVQAWATLLDEGTYLASEATMYRLLGAGITDGRVHDRRRQATHPHRTVPEFVANGPCRVWSSGRRARQRSCCGPRP